MKKLMIFLWIFCAYVSSAQFSPDYRNNFWKENEKWRIYFESERQKQATNEHDGDEEEKQDENEDYSKYQAWRSFWSAYMPLSGNYDEARKVCKALENHQLTRKSAGSSGKSMGLNSTGWTEIGPKFFNNLLSYNSPSWTNPHTNAAQTAFDGSVGRFDRLYKHPTDANTIFACAGNYESAGGGLFVSNDGGATWHVAGTDKIPNPKVMCVSVKPASQSPYLNTEIWFIGLLSGSVYRSMDQGATWDRVNNYIDPTYGIDSYTDENNNIAYDIYTHNIIFIPNQLNQYATAVVAGLNGLYYSTNYGDPSATNILWEKFNFTMPPNYNGNAVSANTYYTFTDVEFYLLNNVKTIVANLVKVERDASSNLIDYRHYVLHSSYNSQNAGYLAAVNLTVVGGNYTAGPNSGINYYGGTTSQQNFWTSNIEVKSSNPNYIYVSYAATQQSTQVIYRYDFAANSWTNISETNLQTLNGAAKQEAHAFAIDPQNDNNYYIIGNNDRKYVGSTLTLNSYICYGCKKHADSRDVLVDYVGSQSALWVATDGGVYKSTDDGVTFVPKSEGLNTAETRRVGISQKPPFYITTAMWHAGAFMYDPSTINPSATEPAASGIWHTWRIGDGNYSHASFLNPAHAYFWDQGVHLFELDSGYVDTSIYYSGLNPTPYVSVASSENIFGLAFGCHESNSPYGYRLLRSLDDFHTYTSLTIPGFNSVSLPDRFPQLYSIPNDPDRLLVVDCYKSGSNPSNPDRILFLKDMRTANPSVELSLNIESISSINSGPSTSNFDYGASLVLDPIVPKKFWMVYRGYPTSPGDQANRIICYDPALSQFRDVTYKVENQNDFPYYISIFSIEMDRQTGILYLGTSNGVYYLDEANQVWMEYSDNVPHITSDLTVNHCLGEIYSSTGYRGIWKAPLFRTGTVPREWHITNNETWTERKNLFCTLVIDPGVTLEIQSDLMVYGQQQIIVKPGAELKVNGGRISTECGTMWDGIFVEGTNTAGQVVATNAQARATFYNNAVIENSYNGVANYGLLNGSVDWSKTGGIINASGANFLNNGRSAEFQAYSGGLSISKFSRCLFEFNRLLNDQITYPGNNGTDAMVTINSVNGILFEDNTFRNTFATGLVSPNFGKGIKANECVFTVQKNTLTTGNTFRNLYRGIELTRTNLTSGTMLINNNTFADNRVGVYFSGNSASNQINNNIFMKSSLPAYTTANAYYGVLLDATTDFDLQNNSFSNFTYACFIRNSSLSSAEAASNVYGNSFTNNYRSVTSQYSNYNLNIKCNIFSNPAGVAQMYWINYNGISNQGSCSGVTQPAGNVFWETPVQKDIYNFSTANTFTYCHHGSAAVPYTMNEVVPSLYPSQLPVLTPCTLYTFDRSVACDGVLPPSQQNDGDLKGRMMEMDNKIRSKNYELVRTSLNEISDESYRNYYSNLLPILETGKQPDAFSREDLKPLHDLALTDNANACANARNIFIFYFNEEFTFDVPELPLQAENTESVEIGDKPVLYQNEPNPFGKQTSIRIYLPEKKGTLELTDIIGRTISSYELKEKINVVTIEGQNLEGGIHFYSLKIDGKIIDTKKMLHSQ